MSFGGLSCSVSRGGIFNHSMSTSYVGGKLYNFSAYAVFHDFGFNQIAGQVGLESFEFNTPKETGDNSSKVLKDVIMTEISDFGFTWLGMLGLNDRRTNLSDIGGMKAPQETTLHALKRQNIIPSVSWSYTAGSRWCKLTSLP